MERKGSNKSRSRVPDAAKLKGKLCSTNDKTEPGKKKHNNKSDRLAVHAPVPPPPPLCSDSTACKVVLTAYKQQLPLQNSYEIGRSSAYALVFSRERERERSSPSLSLASGDRRARGDGRSALLGAAAVSEKLRLVCDWTIC